MFFAHLGQRSIPDEPLFEMYRSYANGSKSKAAGGGQWWTWVVTDIDAWALLLMLCAPPSLPLTFSLLHTHTRSRRRSLQKRRDLAQEPFCRARPRRAPGCWPLLRRQPQVNRTSPAQELSSPAPILLFIMKNTKVRMFVGLR